MTVYQLIIPSIHIDRKSVFRYLGCRNFENSDIHSLVETFSAQAEQEAVFRICYVVVPTKIADDGITFGDFPTVYSSKLADNLRGTSNAVLFCATCGVYFDRKIAAAKLHPAQALLWDAVGTAAIEQLCDDFCEMMHTVRPRFSPGYGDLPLAFQKDLLQWLDTAKEIGVCLTDSLLMTPTKSVTAIAAQE